MFVKFNQIEPLGEGSQADFTLWFGRRPIRWAAVHSDVNPHEGFTDTQVEGPIQAWVHRHVIQRMTDETIMIVDEIEGLPSKLLQW